MRLTAFGSAARRMPLRLIFLSWLTLLGPPVDAAEVDFNSEIRPILAANCLDCHGPDGAVRKAGLGLHDRALATRELESGRRAIVPGEPAASALLHRVRASDPDDLMPPPESGRTLGDEQILLLERWIREGARYDEHWAFVAPTRRLPRVAAQPERGWARNGIDLLVWEKLAEHGLEPSPPASPETLLRRVALDLTGLPPSPELAAEFLRDPSDDAYLRAVDRLLESPAYGERWASVWLDLARYADTKGYEADRRRTLWPYRDWVIRALQDDLPFDEFTRLQLAGDLLPDPTPDQLLATAFHRNTMTNDEGGTDDEEFRMAAVGDRVDTTMQVWMGLTMGCASCHDHKYDPISQREYYQFFDYFNQTEDSDKPDDRPTLAVESDRHRERVDALRRELAGVEEQIAARQEAWTRARSDWLRRRADERHPGVGEGLELQLDLNGVEGGRVREEDLGSPEPRVEGEIESVPGVIDRGARFERGASVDLGDRGDFERDRAFSFGAWLYLEGDGVEIPIARMDDTSRHRGWDLYFAGRKAHVHLIHDWPENALRLAGRAALPARRWSHVFVTYDGSSRPEGVRLYVDGAEMAVEVTHRALTGSIRTDKPLQLGRRFRQGSFGGAMDDVRLYARRLDAGEVVAIVEEGIGSLARRLPDGEMPPEWSGTVESVFRRRLSEEDRSLLARRRDLEEEIERERSSRPRVPILKELPEDERRPTHVLKRGSFLSPLERVEATVPAVFRPPGSPPANRLELADWLVRADNPLTARVQVNRIWERLFGVGLVETSEDFGTQGALPANPSLLDALALELIEGGWRFKPLLKRIVCSSTYRQSSAVTPDRLERDPRNRLLSRGPRFRLPAEAIRDQALAVSGLLSRKRFGPPVFPPQPEGIWQMVYSDDRWIPSEGEDRYRRAIYTFWRRTSPYPSLETFDGTSREICTPRRIRTNTPLQALVTLNDPVFHEAAQALARRVIRERPAPERIDHALRLCLCRGATDDERRVLRELLEDERERYEGRPEAARALQTLPIGSEDEFDLVELAAWTVVASVLLNLDEFLTKE